MSSQPNGVRELLRRAAAEFERNGLSRSVIRQCERDAPGDFLEDGLHVMLDSDESTGYRFLAVMLVNSPLVFQKLTDRWQFSRDQAVKIAQGLLRVDQSFDTKLTALLPDRNNSVRPFALGGENVARALEVLDEISMGRRIVPMMRHLTDHPDPTIASKAALLIGKRMQNLAWTRRVIGEATAARSRANAIETMWGVTSAEAIQLFRECLEDYDNRVVGNAVIGLHKAGVGDTAEVLSRIAANSHPKIRMTAAWAIGQIGDAKLVSVLTPLAKDKHPEVRRAAMKSLRNFHMEDTRAKESNTRVEPVEMETAQVEHETVPARTVAAPARQFWS